MNVHWRLLLAVTLIASFAAAQETNQDEELQTISTTGEPVVTGDGTVTLPGVLDPIETLRLATRDPGIIAEVFVSEGSVVKSGDTIAVLDTEMFAAEVNAAENELQIAKQETKNDVDLEYARISSEVNQQVLTRSRSAAEQFPKSVSATELERLRLEYERSRLSGLQAERQQQINQLTESLKLDNLSWLGVSQGWFKLGEALGP